MATARIVEFDDSNNDAENLHKIVVESDVFGTHEFIVARIRTAGDGKRLMRDAYVLKSTVDARYTSAAEFARTQNSLVKARYGDVDKVSTRPNVSGLMARRLERVREMLEQRVTQSENDVHALNESSAKLTINWEPADSVVSTEAITLDDNTIRVRCNKTQLDLFGEGRYAIIPHTLTLTLDVTPHSRPITLHAQHDQDGGYTITHSASNDVFVLELVEQTHDAKQVLTFKGGVKL